MLFPDISEHYRRQDYVEREEKAWSEAKFYLRHAAGVNRVLELTKSKSVLEVACGSGWVPTQLSSEVEYTGLDRLDLFLDLAKSKNPGKNRTFICGDLREVLPALGGFDIVCSFATMKHFGLHEWDSVLGLLLSKATYGVLELAISTSDFDNGQEFHHVFAGAGHAAEAIRAAGHEVLAIESAYEGSVWDPIQTNGKRSIAELTYFTRRKA
jgi:SAM-dependent methyltransferase